jgi:NAD(P)-dependent dehydrogenase (short-subunit alcohol dehydrogenase family)
MRLENKVILITGSVTGIGKAIAKRCVAEGAKVLIHGLEADLGEQTLAELGADKAVLVLKDLADEDAPQVLVEKAVAALAELDAVVNNAAQVGLGNIHDTDAKWFRRMLEINCVVPYLSSRPRLPHLREDARQRHQHRQRERLERRAEFDALLSVSKGALMTLTRNLGDTLMREDGVRVNQINPGWVLTENEAKRKREHGLKDDWYADLPKVYAPAGRILWPEEIAACAAWLLADECGPISGQVFDLEQHPFIGRNPPKDANTIPSKP